jgi:hypothetical protein
VICRCLCIRVQSRLLRNQEVARFGSPPAVDFCGFAACMGVPVARRSDSWSTDLAMTDCEHSGDLGVRPINGGRGGAMEQRGDGLDGPPVSPPERVPTPSSARSAGWRRFSSPGPLRCLTPG